PSYLEQAMVAFAKNQEQMRDNLRATFGMFPFGQFEEMGKQNMAMFERAMRMMSPYAATPERAKPAPASPPPPEGENAHLKRLEEQIEAMRAQLEALGKKE